MKNSAYIDKLVKDSSRLKYLTARQALFDRSVDAKGMKTEDSEETVRGIPPMVIKKAAPEFSGRRVNRIWHTFAKF